MDSRPNQLTSAGLDRVALDREWGDFPQSCIPLDVIEQANTGAEIRRPTDIDRRAFAAARAAARQRRGRKVAR